MVHLWRINMDVLRWFKGLFLIGLVSFFLSFFVEWYSFKMFSETDIIASWQFHLFEGWISTVNDSLRPKQIEIPIFINVLVIILIVLTGYTVFFMSIENATELERYRIYAYIMGTLLILVFCYISLFPNWYLIPNDLFYPLVHISESGVITTYSVGLGYILQLISFPLLFPYSIFYISTILKFGQEDNSSDLKVSKLVEHFQEPIDLEKCIAKVIDSHGG